MSEVATLDFVQRNTSIPVPKVTAFDASNENTLGFEWILMERMPGNSLADHWRTMPWTAKQTLVKRLAFFTAQLFRKRFQLVGNLYHSHTRDDTTSGASMSVQTASSEDFVIDKIVSMQFFWADHVKQDVPRGPFRSSAEWLSAHLQFNENDAEQTLKTSDNEDDLEDAEQVASNVQKLFSLLPSTFPSNPKEGPEASALVHADLSRHNILVDPEWNLTAIVDWECVSALPLWKACQLPKFLEGRERGHMPIKDMSSTHDNGEVTELFWEHLMEYEQTQLRAIFLEEMGRIEPSWLEIFSSASDQRKAEFGWAVQYCDDVFRLGVVDKWLDDFAEGDRDGQLWSLRKRMMES